MALDSTPDLTEMSTRGISLGKDGRYVGLTILSPSCADFLQIWMPQTSGTSAPVRACTAIICLSFTTNLQKTVLNIIWTISVNNIVSKVFRCCIRDKKKTRNAFCWYNVCPLLSSSVDHICLLSVAVGIFTETSKKFLFSAVLIWKKD